MRRLLAMLALIAGGFATEVVYPLHCTLIDAARVQVKRRRV